VSETSTPTPATPTPATPTPTPTPALYPPDLLALCQERFGLDELDDQGPVVPRDRVLELAHALREELGFHHFVYCAAAHFLAEGEPGTEGFQPDRSLVAYRVRRLCRPDGRRGTDSFPFRLWVPTGESTPSLTAVWAGADWQEREQYDLVGTLFDGHPDLRRLMMPDDWPGHPLRRDYAIDTTHFPWR